MYRMVEATAADSEPDVGADGLPVGIPSNPGTSLLN